MAAYVRPTWSEPTFRDPARARDLLHLPGDVVCAVRLTPADPDSARMTVVWTSCPGIVVHAGVLHDFPFPVCGCDACDETAGSQADDLEHHVLAIAAGGYREAVRGHLPPWLEVDLRSPDGARSGSSRSRVSPGFDLARRAAARRRLRSSPDGWRPWPAREVRPALQ